MLQWVQQVAAGPARGRRVATDWEFDGGAVNVVRDARYVVDEPLAF